MLIRRCVCPNHPGSDREPHLSTFDGRLQDGAVEFTFSGWFWSFILQEEPGNQGFPDVAAARSKPMRKRREGGNRGYPAFHEKLPRSTPIAAMR
jgi:hypothetical protein